MKALVLSCGTGGGHDAAAAAVMEELQRCGHQATMMNPLRLCGGKVAERVDRTYISIAQKAPRAFGAIYKIGNAYRKLPWRSPVYYANGHASDKLEDYLTQHPVDVVVMTHLFPAEILAYLRNHGVAIPPMVLIATDYTCIPFMEECGCDAYVIPSGRLTEEFIARGIPAERIHPLGIPVRGSFRETMTREEAKAALELEADKRYLLLSGGSIGAGKLQKALDMLCEMTRGTDLRMVAICGNNDQVCEQLQQRHGTQARIIGRTSQMATYLRACDLYMTKPGGLSTTEAAVMEIPLALLPPIPGCENRNAQFFESAGMGINVQMTPESLRQALALLGDADARETMRRNQHTHIPKDAAQQVVGLMAKLAEKA